ncbi:MAG: hypothetical protein JST87_06945 [Bacteroidetes bacterium]|nr:hypothetical protein [Bacteroidota bacterium]MBS1933361.1 hypothetical protein [Bacteroidota bacterium]
MRKIKPALLLLAITVICFTNIDAQTKFEVPKNIELKAKEDYAKYEPAIVDAAKWLEETDLDKEKNKRKEVNAFVLEWISGSPTVTVDINENLAKIYGKNTQLLGVYLASYSRNFIENKNSANKFSAIRAGLISMMNVYKKGIDVSRSKELENLIKLDEENKLDDYINGNFKWE